MCHTYYLKNKNRINTEKLREPQWFTSTPKPFMMNTGQQSTAHQPSSHSHPTKSQLNVGYLPPLHLLFCVQPSRMTVALLMYVATAAAAMSPAPRPAIAAPPLTAMREGDAQAPRSLRRWFRLWAPPARWMQERLTHGWVGKLRHTRAHSPGAKKTSRFSNICRL
jgi:hypothetical protein